MMKKWKRIIAGCLVAVMLAALCTACKTNTPKEEETTVKQIDIDMTNPKEEGDQIVYTGEIKYAPEDYSLWDSWVVEKDGTFYLIHLKGLKGDKAYDAEKEATRGYGVATSKDLLHWEEQEEILNAADSQSEYVTDFHYTGSAIVHNGRCYVFFTMRKWGGQRIGMAWSDDMVTWTEYQGNPVLEPDPEWFIGFNPSNYGQSTSSVWKEQIDCRDFLVIKDPDGEGFIGYFVASAEGIYENSPVAVIGIARSNDLMNWTQSGVVYTPSGVSMPEMVDVFKIGNKWYMTLTTGKDNGGIDMFSDPYISRAQIYATADSPEGPFVEDPEDNVVFGGQYNSGYSSRTIEQNGKRYMMYVDNGTLSLPKEVRVNEKGQLRIYYAEDKIKTLRTGTLTTAIVGQPTTSFGWQTHGGNWTGSGNTFTCVTDKNSWQAAVFDSTSKNMELFFTLEASSDVTQFGVVLSNATEFKNLDSLKNLLVLDRAHDRVYLTSYNWELKNCRSYDFEMGREYQIRVLLVENTIELYINDEMVFNSVFTNAGRNHAGLFANNGTARISNLELFKIES
jgi:predicted GH43/DUF377 family glycosyl hydrolase